MSPEDQRSLIREKILSALQAKEDTSAEDQAREELKREQMLGGIFSGLQRFARADAVSRGAAPTPSGNLYKDDLELKKQVVVDAISKRKGAQEKVLAPLKLQESFVSEDIKEKKAADSDKESQKNKDREFNLAERKLANEAQRDTNKASSTAAGVPTNPVTGLPLTKGEIAADVAFGKKIGSQAAAPGPGSGARENLRRLEEGVKFFESPERIKGFAGAIGGAIAKRIPGEAAPFSPKYIKQVLDIQQAYQAGMKEVLDSQFAQKEAQQVMSRAFEPGLGPEEAALRLKDAARVLRETLDAEDEAKEYFKRGTLAGFEQSRQKKKETSRYPKTVTKGDEETVVSSPEEEKEALAEGWK